MGSHLDEGAGREVRAVKRVYKHFSVDFVDTGSLRLNGTTRSRAQGSGMGSSYRAWGGALDLEFPHQSLPGLTNFMFL